MTSRRWSAPRSSSSPLRWLGRVAVVLLTLVQLSASGQSTPSSFLFKNENTVRLLGPQVQYYLDSSGSASPTTLPRDRFVPASEKILNFGVGNYALWTHFDVTNASKVLNFYLEIDNPLLDVVELYVDRGGQLQPVDAVSNQRHFYDRRIPSQNIVFKVPMARGETLSLYAKIITNAQMLVPMQLHSAQYYQAQGLNRDLLSALYFGMMLSMLLYNVFIYFTVRERIYLHYVLYIASVSLVQLDIKGFGFKFLYPDFIWLQQHATVLYAAFTAFTSIAFMRAFVRVRLFTPRLNKGLWVFIGAYLVAVLLSFTGNEPIAYNMLNLNGLLLAVYMIVVAAFILFKYNFRPAGYFLAAWILFLVGIIVFVLKDVGILPYNTFTTSVLQLGSAVETILLSFALADRINTLKKEKEASQAESLAAAQENERLVRAQNIELEQKVEERTQDLKMANKQLEKTLSNLKETQSQMVEQEKMASLGQLTAGIAHEINNPINFVTSNIRPLRRDFNDILNLFNQVEAIGLDDSPVDSKRQAIEQAKTDVDFEYLKEEVEILLDGIAEGSTRTAEIVKGLRIFSRLDEDDLKRASIQEGLDSTCLIVNNLLDNRIQIIKAYDELPLIECYAGKLNQVFLNLMTNAIHAVKARWGEAHGGELRLTTHRTDRGTITIAITDNGTGMDEATKLRVFEPFFTTKDVGEGTGLGLSITWKTVEKHNGTVNVESEPGCGTTFTIELPIEQPPVVRKMSLSTELA